MPFPEWAVAGPLRGRAERAAPGSFWGQARLAALRRLVGLIVADGLAKGRLRKLS